MCGSWQSSTTSHLRGGHRGTLAWWPEQQDGLKGGGGRRVSHGARCEGEPAPPFFLAGRVEGVMTYGCE